jgi:hypothetical protein
MGETKKLLTPWGIVKTKEGLHASFDLCSVPVTDSHFFILIVGSYTRGHFLLFERGVTDRSLVQFLG